MTAKNTSTPIRPSQPSDADPCSTRLPAGRRAAAGEDAGDHVLRDAREPPADQRQAPALMRRVVDLEPRRIVGDVGERERRVAVGAVRGVRVERDAPRPAQHPDVEIEDPARVAAVNRTATKRDHARGRERQPEEGQHDVMRHDEQPLDEPQPSRRLLEVALEARRVRRCHRCRSRLPSRLTSLLTDHSSARTRASPRLPRSRNHPSPGHRRHRGDRGLRFRDLRCLRSIRRVHATPTWFKRSGAEGGNRTHTPRREPDFESGASASSATSARAGSYRRFLPTSGRHRTFPSEAVKSP